MTWPQIVVVAMLALGLCNGAIVVVRDKSKTSVVATWTLFYYVAYYAAYAWVLHKGGFW